MDIVRPRSRQPIPADAERVFRGKLFDVYQWEQKLFDGSVTTFEKLKRPDTAYVIPVMTDGTLLIAQQQQPGTPTTFGLLGGRIEEGESPEHAAQRELAEEAGLSARSLVLWDSYQFLPKLEWAIYTFVARDCEQLDQRSLDAGEKIDLIRLHFDDLLDLAAREQFGDLEVALRMLRIAKDPRRLQIARELLS